MMYGGLDVYASYADVNADFELSDGRQLSNDRNVEDPALIVGTRKWTWEGMDPEGPDLRFLGLTMQEHVPLMDKYDIFIYGRD
jgi:hypothetical protein